MRRDRSRQQNPCYRRTCVNTFFVPTIYVGKLAKLRLLDIVNNYSQLYKGMQK
jgi:hypothetical protein